MKKEMKIIFIISFIILIGVLLWVFINNNNNTNYNTDTDNINQNTIQNTGQATQKVVEKIEKGERFVDCMKNNANNKDICVRDSAIVLAARDGELDACQVYQDKNKKNACQLNALRVIFSKDGKTEQFCDKVFIENS